MKKILIASLALIGLFPALPVSANPAAEACLNQHIDKSGGQDSTEAQLMATVKHEGSEYHLIQVNYPGPRNEGLEVQFYLRTDSQGGCEKLLSYISDSFPEQSVYHQALGREVYQKFANYFQAQSQN